MTLQVAHTASDLRQYFTLKVWYRHFVTQEPYRPCNGSNAPSRRSKSICRFERSVCLSPVESTLLATTRRFGSARTAGPPVHVMRASNQRETGMPSRWRRVVYSSCHRPRRFFSARGQSMTERLVRSLGRERRYWRLLAMAVRSWVVFSVVYRRHVQTGRYRPCNGSNAPSKNSVKFFYGRRESGYGARNT